MLLFPTPIQLKVSFPTNSIFQLTQNELFKRKTVHLLIITLELKGPRKEDEHLENGRKKQKQ